MTPRLFLRPAWLGLLACLLSAPLLPGIGLGQTADPPPNGIEAATAPAEPVEQLPAIVGMPSGQVAPAELPGGNGTIGPSAPESSMPARPPLAGIEAEALPRDLSPWGMFIAADWVVKAVMVGLAFASVVTWTIWLVKIFEILRGRRGVAADLRILRDARNLAGAATSLPERRAAHALAAAASHEIALSEDLAGEGLVDGVKERVAARLPRIEAAFVRRMNQGTGLLATIGATAPFVGLFGTVWGIMNSFIGISEAETTNLAVVAPGIAEALLATALGLVAAIPAVVIYNWCARGIAGYRALLGDVSTEVMRLVSRDLDRRLLPIAPREAA